MKHEECLLETIKLPNNDMYEIKPLDLKDLIYLLNFILDRGTQKQNSTNYYPIPTEFRNFASLNDVCSKILKLSKEKGKKDTNLYSAI